jgi:hypothetical protein
LRYLRRSSIVSMSSAVTVPPSVTFTAEGTVPASVTF